MRGRSQPAGGSKMQTKNLFHDTFIGKKIRFKRKMLKMSQKELGHHLRVSAQQIQKYETGLNRISAGRLNEIANILNVPLSFFYAEILTKQEPPYHHDEIISSEEEYLLLKSFRVLNSVKQKAILQLISDQK
ncbi:helix-turn-helix domain-containing protein [Bartonella vinsonii]|uniref:Transcriptional repressor DicA n=1 Tax=Bartonella vinsonii TaxID=33047 RepID=A0A3S5C5U9_BARVI|nr:helix-turn-helix transcriptional regulator [Bartonella vinsonii]VEJ44431.1 transcriptional repressor DicA [Bartonella vinsonii]